MRSEIEIYRAHDILTALTLGEVPGLPTDIKDRKPIIAALDALCWVLEHDKTDERNCAFGDNLAKLEKDLSALGFHLHRKNN